MKRLAFLLTTTLLMSCESEQAAPPQPEAKSLQIIASIPADPPPPATGCATALSPSDQFPPDSPHYPAIVQAAANAYNSGGYDWRIYKLPGAYKFDGQYVTISPFIPHGPDVQFDGLGVPQVLVQGVWRYNPVTLSNYALWYHTLHVRDGAPLPSAFWATVGKLQQMTGPDGALRYDYTFDGMPPGWTSAMAQGQVLSVFARAYLFSPDPSLIEYGNRILEFMLKPVPEGGNRANLTDLNPSLTEYVSLAEYDHAVSAHTLNGAMFAMFGLYDWARLADRFPDKGVKGELASKYFACSAHTIATTLPYYDIGGWSAYDLDHMLGRGDPSAGAVYHRIHIAQLVALYSITGNGAFLHWARNWAPSTQPVT